MTKETDGRNQNEAFFFSLQMNQHLLVHHFSTYKEMEWQYSSTMWTRSMFSKIM